MQRLLLRFLLILTLLAGVSFSAAAQKRERSREEMRKEILDFKLQFLAQEMELTNEQRPKFNELYTQMDKEKMALYQEAQKVEKRAKEGKDATEADYRRAATIDTEMKTKEAAIEKKYNEKFATFLSAKQLYKMKEAEDAFRQKMKKMRKKH